MKIKSNILLAQNLCTYTWPQTSKNAPILSSQELRVQVCVTTKLT